jgi:hypothetical protein
MVLLGRVALSSLPSNRMIVEIAEFAEIIRQARAEKLVA